MRQQSEQQQKTKVTILCEADGITDISQTKYKNNNNDSLTKETTTTTTTSTSSKEETTVDNNSIAMLQNSAKEISNILTEQFNVKDITIRIFSVGDSSRLSSLLDTQSSCDNKIVYLVVSNSNSSVSPSRGGGLLNYVEANSPHPVLSFNVNNEQQEQKCVIALQIAKICGLVNTSIQCNVSKLLTSQKQMLFVQDVQIRTQSPYYQYKISNCLEDKRYVQGINKDKLCNSSGSSSDGNDDDGIVVVQGKVREQISNSKNKKHVDKLIMVTTDRQSGFDRMLAHVPYKGQVLNLTSKFWFDHTSKIIGNHLLDVPHPNVSIVKKCTPFPIEFVMRAYMTGSTSTSIWKNYENGCRMYCGHTLPDNMVKNEKLPKILLTPTTKSTEHDELISATDIVTQGLMTQSDWDTCADAAMQVFTLGQRIAADHGLILVDTKYEMGKDEFGNIILIDEIHTPDSSRYWLAASYEERMALRLEPENIDKEFLRLWFTKHCDPYNDKVLPIPPKELVVELSRRYILLYEMITGQDFVFRDDDEEEEESHIVNVIQGIYRNA